MTAKAGSSATLTNGNAAALPVASAEALFAGTGEVRALARTLDWGTTPLGWPHTWSPALRITTRALLDAPHPVCLWAGPEYALIYNDAYRRILAAKHPGALGQPGSVVWSEIWEELEPQFLQVSQGGPPVFGEDARFVMARLEGGATEVAWFTYSLSALREDDGRIVAVLNISPETTGRVRAEQALEVERQRLRSVVVQAPVPMALHEGPEHRYVLVNAAYRRVSGGRDVTGLRLREAFPEVAGQGLYEVFDRVFSTGEPWTGPETHLHYDRLGNGLEDAWFDLRYEPVRDPEGRVTGILNFSIDVTDQVMARREVEQLLSASQRAVAAVAESERRFRTVQDASPLGFAIHRPVREDGRPDGRVIDFTLPYVNEAGARIVGHPREHLLAGTVLSIWPGTGPEGVFADYVRVLETGEPGYREILYEHDGLAAGLTLTVVRIGEGADAELGITFTDVTARLRAERERDRLFAELGTERERLRAVILSMPSPLALHVGPEHRFELVNTAFRRISGGGRDDTGRTVREAFPELLGQGIIEALDRVYATGEPWIGAEVPIRYDRDGTGLQDTWYNVRYESVRDPDGGVWGVLNFAVDVTDQVRARQDVERLLAASERERSEAEAARAEAQAANRAKGEFLAVMSHELRTPLNAIGGYAELIELGIHGPVTDAQRTALERIQRSQRHLLGLIAGVLDYSRVEAGAVTYRLVDVAVAEAVAEAELLVAPQLRAKGLGYAWSGAGADLAVRADREKLQQVLLNLFSNAVKFTDARDGVPGRIEVGCTVDEGTNGPGAGGCVRLHVRDTGGGIAADEIERVFEPFVQADQRLTRPHGGVGLGLAISRDLARGMGGDLTVESTPGVGSTFTLTLPRA